MIQIDRIEESCKLNYIGLKKIFYKQKGIEKSWEIAEMFDSVAILIYHKTKNSFVLVKQFRPPVFLKNNDGFTYELCAGILDKNISSLQTAKEEILEETGYNVELKNIEKVTEFYTSVGSSGAKQELFYCEVDDKNKINAGGGIDDEDIEVIYLNVEEMNEFIFDTTKAKTPGIMFALNWWEKFKK